MSAPPKINPKKLAKAKQLEVNGDPAACMAYYYELLQKYPAHPQISNTLAVSLFKKKEFNQAISILEPVLASYPNALDCLNNLAIAYINIGERSKAIVALQKLLQQNPNYAEGHNNLANLFAELDDHTTATHHFKQATELKSDYAMAWNNLGCSLIKLHRYPEAIEALKKAIDLDTSDPRFFVNLAKVYFKQANFEKARDLIVAVLDSLPLHFEANLLLAEYQLTQHNYVQSETILQNILTQYKNHPEAYLLMGELKVRQGNIEQACSTFQQYFKKTDKPSLHAYSQLLKTAMDTCQWQLVREVKVCIDKYIQTYGIKEPIHPFASLCMFDDPKQQYLATKQWVKHLAKPNSLTLEHHQHDKLRIGYISPDFSDHPLGLLVENFFQLHNRDNFQIHGFITQKHNSDRFQHICSGFDKTHDIEQLHPLDAATVIQKAEIDILVDLTGYTEKDNLAILAYQPAAIQIQWLGYPGSMGADFIQYTVGDLNLIPHRNKSFYTEKMIELPLWFAGPHFKQPAQLPTRQEYALPKDKIILCCHHMPYRIEESTFNAWLEILHHTQNTILWLSGLTEIVEKRLLIYAKQVGINADRFVFSEKILLSTTWAHQLADLWLDSFNFTAGTSTLLANWVGLPVLTTNGHAHSSKIAASYCLASACPEQVVANRNNYIKRAIELSNNPELLKNMRKQLMKQRKQNNLFNQAKLMQHWEAALVSIAEDKQLH